MQLNDSNVGRSRTWLIALVCFLLQVMLSPHLGSSMGFGRINFALIFCAIYSLSVGGRSAVYYGFLSGLVFDFVSTGPIGLMSGLLTLAGFVLGREERNRFADGYVGVLSAFGVVAFLVSVTYNLAMVLLEDVSVLDLIMLRALPTFAFTFLAFLPFAYVRVRASAPGRGIGTSRGLNSSALSSGHYDISHIRNKP